MAKLLQMRMYNLGSFINEYSLRTAHHLIKRAYQTQVDVFNDKEPSDR